MKWTKEQQKRFEKFILGDDMDFYEEYTIHLTDEEQEKFFEENPEFMSEYPISRDMIYLLRDPMYRGLMRKIKKYETGVDKNIAHSLHFVSSRWAFLRFKGDKR